MIVLEYESVEVDYCLSCQGVWLDAGEIELLFGDAAACEQFLNSGDPSVAGAEKPRRCPICRKKMDKAVTGGDKPVVYDRCAQGDGLWFDEGELAAILVHGSAMGGGEKVAAFLQGMFEDPGSTREPEVLDDAVKQE